MTPFPQDIYERLDALRSALERLRWAFGLVLAGKPCRDVQETLGEVDAALEAHAKCEGQQMCDGAVAERSDQNKGNDMTDSTLTELMPCPFCGSENVCESLGTKGDGSPWPYIECEECAANAEPEVWNRRATQGAATPPAPEPVRLATFLGNRVVFGVSNAELAEFIREFFATPPAIREPEPTAMKLRPCPFCGGAAEKVATGEPQEYVLQCSKCGAASAVVTACMDSPDGHLETLWNRRAALATPAPAPSIPVVHPAGLAPGAVEQGSSNSLGMNAKGPQ